MWQIWFEGYTVDMSRQRAQFQHDFYNGDQISDLTQPWKLLFKDLYSVDVVQFVVGAESVGVM